MRKTIGILLSVCLFWACNSPSEDQSKGKDSSQTAKPADTVNTQQPEVVQADEHTLTDKIALQSMHLLGKEVQCRYAETPERLKELLPGIMQAISDSKAVITGSYHIVLTENPDASKPTRIFIGIPIQKPLKANGMNLYTIPAGKYLRRQCAAEPGKSLSVHQGMMTMSNGKLKQKAGLPIIEKYAETRNDEMTSVISKATFYYTLTQ
jgi:hypothetical protein